MKNSYKNTLFNVGIFAVTAPVMLGLVAVPFAVICGLAWALHAVLN